VSKASLMLEEFLAKELDAKRWNPTLVATTPTQVLVHGHCHQKAFGTLKALRKVLGVIPGLQVEWIESSCCGMAGSFGYEAEHHAMSLRMAELSLLPAVRAAAPEALILASGTSCRHQIHDGAQRSALHLAQLLQRLRPQAVSP
jgi:glycerol-3-phosphate dehydrogenase subunit C